ncbi:ABC transporter permease subunit, partial [Yaniella sp.]|uniref:ABC transporter permease subunit n=1 Tax=Yaniella sp. TaxID=2773929 RepID=UPI0026472670
RSGCDRCQGQREAAMAVGMTPTGSLRVVEVPQSLVAMLPSLVAQFVIILKDSALGYIIGFSELLRYSRHLGAGYGNILQAMVVGAVIFIAINFILVWLAQTLSRRLSTRTSGDVDGASPGMVNFAANAPDEHDNMSTT